jgi:hypothetical protein
MTNSEKFINWLEGYLDACKNTLDPSQVKTIRKKIKECSTGVVTGITYSPHIYGNGTSTSVPLYDSFNQSSAHEMDPEFLKEIEKNKNASTMEALQEDGLFEDIKY